MRNLFLFIAAVIAVACSQNQDVSKVESSATIISVDVEVDQTADSRVEVSDNGDGSWDILWSPTDCLGGWSVEAAHTSQTFFDITDGGFDQYKSTFSGEVVDGAMQMRLFYPYNEQLVKGEDNTIALSLAEQSSSADFSQLAGYIYMMSDIFDVDSQQTTSPGLKHIGAAIELMMKFSADSALDAADYTPTQVTLADIMPIEAKLDVAEDVTGENSLEVTQYGDMTITANSIEADENGIYTIRFATFPFVVEPGGSLTLTATFVDSQGNSYTATSTLDTDEQIAFERATYNQIYALFEELTTQEPIVISIDASTTALFGNSSDASDFEYIVDEANFIARGFYYYSASLNCYILKSGCYIYNTTAMKGLSKIVFEIYSDPTFYIDLYVGDQVNPTSSKLEYSADGDYYTYNVEDGSSYFRIENNNSSSSTRLKGVEFYFESLGQ